jgi:hypothetical protein
MGAWAIKPAPGITSSSHQSAVSHEFAESIACLPCSNLSASDDPVLPAALKLLSHVDPDSPCGWQMRIRITCVDFDRISPMMGWLRSDPLMMHSRLGDLLYDGLTVGYGRLKALV